LPSRFLGCVQSGDSRSREYIPMDSRNIWRRCAGEWLYYGLNAAIKRAGKSMAHPRQIVALSRAGIGTQVQRRLSMSAAPRYQLPSL
jgi:hypothetical protein